MQTYIYLGYVGVGANIAQNHSTSLGKSYLVIIALIHMKHWVGSNFAQNHHLPSLVSFLASIQIKNVPKVYPISNTFDL